MTAELPVVVDAMGGDDAPAVVVEGAVRAQAEGIPVTLVGDEAVVGPLLPRRNAPVLIHAPEAVAMDDGAKAVRRMEGASVRVVMREVAEHRGCAAVCFGNTGATLVSAVLDLGVLEDVDRPALATVLPNSSGGRLVMLDAGANVDCKPEMLVSFALLGAAYAEALGVENPRVGLLANGEEEGKGNVQTRATLPLLRQLPLTVVGNVEPTAAMDGACDVLVCDGFVGNVLLKAAEGAASTIQALLREEIGRRPSGMLGAWLLTGAFRRFRNRVNWDAHGGAVLLGTRGVVVAGHGRANADAVHAGIDVAWRAAQEGLVDGMARHLEAWAARD